MPKKWIQMPKKKNQSMFKQVIILPEDKTWQELTKMAEKRVSKKKKKEKPKPIKKKRNLEPKDWMAISSEMELKKAPLKVYLLKIAIGSPTDYPIHSQVVLASSERQARELARDEDYISEEKSSIWLAKSYVICREIGLTGKARSILVSGAG